MFSLDTTSPCRPYVTTMKTMQFNEDFLALPMKIFQNNNILVIDVTSLQDEAEQLDYPELSGESLILEMFFQITLEQLTEVIVLGENELIESKQFLKMFNDSSFSGSYQNLVLFWDFPSLLSLYYLLCLSSELKLQKKENKCCLNENLRHFFNLDCEKMFNNLCPLYNACEWDFVGSKPKCV